MRRTPADRAARAWLLLVAPLVLGATAVCWAQVGWAQIAPESVKPPVSPAPAASFAYPAETSGPSRVFPEAGFPGAPVAAEGSLPLAPQRATYPALQPPSSDYPSGTVQDAPGAGAYEPVLAPLPDYYFWPEYYNAPGVGARPIADYAPPGYEPREFQDAPGVPEFTRIVPPPPVSPAAREQFLTRGMMPGSWLVPGSSTSFRLRGFVRLAGLYDLNPIGSRDDFVTNSIPVPQEDGLNCNLAARYSRFALETWTPTSICEWNVHTFIEGDFFNGPAQAVGGGGNPFRLRFAFIDFGYFRIGQQNSVFMDSSAFPSTVDFAGPRGLVNQRRAGFRVTLPITDMLFWAGGIEQPFADITTNGLGVNVQEAPDVASHLRYETDFGHVQLSGIARSIGYRPNLGEATREAGWGASASTVFHPWALLIDSNPLRKDNPSGLERSRILLQYTLGSGIGRYLQDTAGLALDAHVDPLTGSLGTVDATGWSASYEHWFNEHWLSNVTYSSAVAEIDPAQPGNTYHQARYLAASLWWIPITRMSIGMEYLWGERENLDAQRAQANRLNALFQYNF